LGKDQKTEDDKQVVKFDIAQVTVEKTNLTYRDEGTGAQYALKELNLKTGRIANGVPGQIDLSVAVQGNQPKLDVTTQLKTTLTFDLEKQQYQLADMDLQLNGVVLDISNLKLNASGDASANLSTQEFTANKYKLNVTGTKAKEAFEVTLDAPALSMNRDKFTGEKLTLNAKLGEMVAALSLPDMAGNAQSFKVSALSLDLDIKQIDQAFKVKLVSP